MRLLVRVTLRAPADLTVIAQAAQSGFADVEDAGDDGCPDASFLAECDVQSHCD